MQGIGAREPKLLPLSRTAVYVLKALFSVKGFCYHSVLPLQESWSTALQTLGLLLWAASYPPRSSQSLPAPLWTREDPQALITLCTEFSPSLRCLVMPLWVLGNWKILLTAPKRTHLEARGQPLCVRIGKLGFLIWGPRAPGKFTEGSEGMVEPMKFYVHGLNNFF